MPGDYSIQLKLNQNGSQTLVNDDLGDIRPPEGPMPAGTTDTLAPVNSDPFCLPPWFINGL